MAHQYAGDAGLPEDTDDFVTDLISEMGVQVGEWLVHQYDDGLRSECPRQRDPLLLTSGQLVRIAVVAGRQVEAPKDLPGPARTMRLGHGIEAERHVLPHGEVREQGVVLKHHAHPPPLGRNPAPGTGHLPPPDEDPALVRDLESRDQAECRRLPAARGSENRQDLALPDIEGDIDECLDPTGPVALAYAVELDDWGRQGSRSGWLRIVFNHNRTLRSPGTGVNDPGSASRLPPGTRCRSRPSSPPGRAPSTPDPSAARRRAERLSPPGLGPGARGVTSSVPAAGWLEAGRAASGSFSSLSRYCSCRHHAARRDSPCG